jgi:hypothetical protein
MSDYGDNDNAYAFDDGGYEYVSHAVRAWCSVGTAGCPGTATCTH